MLHLLSCFLFLFSFLSASSAFSRCLPLEETARGYLADHPVIAEEAPFTLQCREAVLHGYTPHYLLHQLLGKVILKQLQEERVLCRRLLAVKSFFLFDQLYWISDTEEYKDIKAAVEQIIGMPVSRVSGGLDFYKEGMKQKQYCSVVKDHIDSLQHDGFWLGVEKKIDLAPLILEDDKVYRFMKWTKRCKESREKTKERFAKVRATSLRLRAEPSVDGSVVRNLPKGELLRLGAKLHYSGTVSWVQVWDMNCETGWVASEYLLPVITLKKSRDTNTVLLTASPFNGEKRTQNQLTIHGLEKLTPPPSVRLYRKGYVFSPFGEYRSGYVAPPLYRRGYVVR